MCLCLLPVTLFYFLVNSQWESTFWCHILAWGTQRVDNERYKANALRVLVSRKHFCVSVSKKNGEGQWNGVGMRSTQWSGNESTQWSGNEIHPVVWEWGCFILYPAEVVLSLHLPLSTTHLDSIAIGVTDRDLEIIATVSPGASRSRSGRVALDQGENDQIHIGKGPAG